MKKLLNPVKSITLSTLLLSGLAFGSDNLSKKKELMGKEILKTQSAASRACAIDNSILATVGSFESIPVLGGLLKLGATGSFLIGGTIGNKVGGEAFLNGMNSVPDGNDLSLLLINENDQKNYDYSGAPLWLRSVNTAILGGASGVIDMLNHGVAVLQGKKKFSDDVNWVYHSHNYKYTRALRGMEAARPKCENLRKKTTQLISEYKTFVKETSTSDNSGRFLAEKATGIAGKEVDSNTTKALLN